MTEALEADRLAIIVKSDTYEDILLSLSFAGIGASSGMEVVLFFTNRAARRLKTGGFDDIEDGVDEVGRAFIDGARALGFRALDSMLRDVKASGRVRVFLCSRGARIWDIDSESMLTEVDSVMGTATFLLEEVRRAGSVLTI